MMPLGSSFFSKIRQVAKNSLRSNPLDGKSVGSELATEDDLISCYRLLLGRWPDAPGWPSFFKLVRSGVTIENLVKHFLASPEFKIYSSVSEKNSFKDVQTAEGFSITVDESDSAIGQYILEQRTYEPHVTEQLKVRVQEGMTVLDVGANIGYFTLLASKLVGSKGKVLAFEPSSINCALIDYSVKQNKFTNVNIFPFAVSETSGTKLYDPHCSNGFVSDWNSNFQDLKRRIIVRSISLDQMFLNSIDKVDAIKIDIEGGEYCAILGMQKILERDHPVILTEFSPPALIQRSGVEGVVYLEKLKSLGYRFSVIEQTGKLTRCENDLQRVIDMYSQFPVSHLDLLCEFN